MRQVLFVVSCVVATVLSTNFASATIRITADRGGRIIDYVERFTQARASGEQVVIDRLGVVGLALGSDQIVVGYGLALAAVEQRVVDDVFVWAKDRGKRYG